MAKKLKHSIELAVYSNVDELSPEDKELVIKAKEVSKKAQLI